MNRRPFGLVAAVVIATLAHTGCYALSPLDAAPLQQLDRALVGEWRCIPPDPKEPDSAIVTIAESREKAMQYDVSWQEGKKAPDRYRAFGSRVLGEPYLNVRGPEEEPGKGDAKPWVFVRYALLAPRVLQLKLVKERLYKEAAASTTPAAARATLEKALARKEAVLEDFALCTAAREKP